MNRRAFLFAAAAGVAIGVPQAIGAQPVAARRIGFIANSPRTPITDAFWNAFVAGLQEHGWAESRNLAIERRYVGLGSDAVAAADELVRRRVEVIVVSSTQTALAAKRTTTTVPIVMTIPADPVAVGLVESLSRPGGNVTGLSFVGTEMSAKQLELLHAAVANLTSIAVLANPMNASHPPRTREVLATARALKIQVHVVEARSTDEITEVFRVIGTSGVGAALVLADPVFVREVDNIIRLAARQRLPVMYGLREAPLAGGLMSYGADLSELFRRAAGYVDKILRGARPQDLPIEQASKFELVINLKTLKTAKALGLTIPPALLLRADRVIE